MGNLAVTPAQVQPVAGGQVVNGNMGEDGDAGEAVYLDAASNKWKLEDADIDTNAATLGVLENTAANGQPCSVMCVGEIDLGIDAGVIEGRVYVASPTPGKLCARADALMVAGKYVKVFGIGAALNIVKLKPHSTDQKVQ